MNEGVVEWATRKKVMGGGWGCDPWGTAEV